MDKLYRTLIKTGRLILRKQERRLQNILCVRIRQKLLDRLGLELENKPISGLRRGNRVQSPRRDQKNVPRGEPIRLAHDRNGINILQRHDHLHAGMPVLGITVSLRVQPKPHKGSIQRLKGLEASMINSAEALGIIRLDKITFFLLFGDLI